jgi:hypothetical protein
MRPIVVRTPTRPTEAQDAHVLNVARATVYPAAASCGRPGPDKTKAFNGPIRRELIAPPPAA